MLTFDESSGILFSLELQRQIQERLVAAVLGA
mgnify:CR=1 FL=1